jgi:phosphoglucomutase
MVIKTVVTTYMIDAIAKKNNVACYNVLTGFKWIAELIKEKEGKENYIIGGEESFGLMVGDKLRDKDAVSACSLLAEICAWAKDQGKTLFDVLMEIYVEYGFSLNHTINVVKPGKSGADEIKAMMENFRANAPREIAGSKVILTKDYKTLVATDAEGNTTAIDQPETSNVLQWYTEDGSKVSVRPSGTEPKIKFYIEVKGEMKSAADYAKANAEAEAKVEAIRKSLNL